MFVIRKFVHILSTDVKYLLLLVVYKSEKQNWVVSQKLGLFSSCSPILSAEFQMCLCFYPDVSEGLKGALIP